MNKEIEQTEQSLERLEAQEALRESEERYRAVVQQVSEAIFLLDVQTMHVLEANQAFQRLFGYSESEIRYLTIYDLLPYERGRIDLTTKRVIEQGEYHVKDRQYRHKDGSLVNVEVGMTPISYGGKLVLCEVLRDITDRKKIEDALAARVQQQAVVAELGQRALAGLDPAALMDEAVGLTARTLDMEYCKVLELIPGSGELFLRAGFGWREGLVGYTTIGAGLNSQAGYALASEEPVIVEDLSIETRFNEPVLLVSHNVVSGMSVIIQGRDRPFGVLGVHSSRQRHFTRDDIYFLQAIANVLAAAIERNQVEEQLQASRDQLEVILQGVADGITVQDPLGKLIYANNAALRLIGYSSQAEFLATPSDKILDKFELLDEHNQPIPAAQLPGRYALRGQETAEMLVGWRRHDTDEVRWSTVHAAPVKDEQGHVQFAVSIFRDISDRIERERRKDDFIALASHELKTPITSLRILTQLLKKRFERAVAAGEMGTTEPGGERALQRDAVKQLARIDEQLNKLTELVKDLLDVSKIGAGQLSYTMERFDIDELVRETVEDLQDITEKHTIEFEGWAELNVLADRERIRQVLTNFITNAVKYSPGEGKIIVGVQSERGNKGAQAVIVYVKDFGIGIPKSAQSKLFDRFFQVGTPEVDEAGRGTFPGLGLGLYISSEIIKRHKGRIWVESEMGKGSTFYFRLPVGT